MRVCVWRVGKKKRSNAKGVCVYYLNSTSLETDMGHIMHLELFFGWNANLSFILYVYRLT